MKISKTKKKEKKGEGGGGELWNKEIIYKEKFLNENWMKYHLLKKIIEVGSSHPQTYALSLSIFFFPSEIS